MDEVIQEIKNKAVPILKEAGVKRSSVFGSAARGEAASDSDIDLLIELSKDSSLLDFIGLKIDLEKALGRKVDLVEYDTIKPLLREKILNEEVAIL